ncbi:MAG: N-acetylmuramoyl-L-alanine amidase-like domain-containing protein [Myxococcales bacterium]
MTAALLATLVAAAPVLAMTGAQLDAKIAEAHRLPFAERIGALSELFVGVPYTDFPLGDGPTGPEPGPLFRTDGVDCQTYVETVLAMANAGSLGQARSILDDIRYADGKPSFQTRNHFTEAQWLPANTRKGYLTDEVPGLDRGAPTSTLTLVKEQWAQVPALKRLAPANIPDGKYRVRYLPLDQVQKHAGEIVPGTVAMVVRENDPARVVRITHMGFVVRTRKGLAVRHASTGNEHAVIDEPFDAFVRRQAEYKKWKVAGIAFARPLDASRRVAHIQTASR